MIPGLLLWIHGLAAAAPGPPGAPVIPEDVQTTIRRRVEYAYSPGIVVGMMNTNGAAYFSYGEARRGTGQPPDERTLFEIGSVTKVFTATLLADLAEHGDLGLDDPVQQYLPADVHAPVRNGKWITLTHLATHTSGLPSFPSNVQPATSLNPFEGITAEIIYDFLNHYQLTRDPGSIWEYSNFAVGLLGHVLSLRMGQAYEDLIVGRIASELRLEDTRIRLSTEQESRRATGYSGVVEVPPFEMGSLAGAGSLRSTASDLLAFLAANRGWSPSSLASAMTNAQRFRTSTPAPGLGMGLGWLRKSLRTDTALMHDGATIGQRAFIGFLSQGKTVVAVLANSNYDIVDIGLHLLDPGSPLTSPRTPHSVPDTLLRTYVGRFIGPAGDYFDITLQSGSLILRYSGDGELPFTLYPMADNKFYTAALVEADGTFQTNSSGRATALIWHQSSQSTRYSRGRIPARLTLQRTEDGSHAQILISGEGDRPYVVEASQDFRQWTAVSTNSIWDFPTVDIGPDLAGFRFFRAVEGSP